MMFCSLIWPLRWFRVRLPKGIAMLRIYFKKTHEMVIPSGKLKCGCLHSHKKNMIININHCLEWEINQDHKNRKAGIIRGSYHWTGETQDNKTPSLNELTVAIYPSIESSMNQQKSTTQKKNVDHESILQKHVGEYLPVCWLNMVKLRCSPCLWVIESQCSKPRLAPHSGCVANGLGDIGDLQRRAVGPIWMILAIIVIIT